MLGLAVNGTFGWIWTDSPRTAYFGSMAHGPLRDPRSYDASVLENFVDAADRLISVPVQRKKRLAVLRWLAEDFQPGRRYSEADVNRIISRRHPDFAALRRYLVDEEMMQRRRSVYWRTGSVPNLGFDPPSWPE